jgi:hypothetical protein
VGPASFLPISRSQGPPYLLPLHRLYAYPDCLRLALSGPTYAGCLASAMLDCDKAMCSFFYEPRLHLQRSTSAPRHDHGLPPHSYLTA